jgi:hypothetical protein
MTDEVYERMSPTANKMLNPDGSVTTFSGEDIGEITSDDYKYCSARANKFINPDGTIHTLDEILPGVADLTAVEQQVSANTAAISEKADSSTVTTLQGEVTTNAANIAENATAIEGKADTLVVATLQECVSFLNSIPVQLANGDTTTLYEIIGNITSKAYVDEVMQALQGGMLPVDGVWYANNNGNLPTATADYLGRTVLDKPTKTVFTCENTGTSSSPVYAWVDTGFTINNVKITLDETKSYFIPITYEIWNYEGSSGNGAATMSYDDGWGITINAYQWTIPDGSVTKSKLEQSVQNSLGKADSSVQSVSDTTEIDLTLDSAKALSASIKSGSIAKSKLNSSLLYFINPFLAPENQEINLGDGFYLRHMVGSLEVTSASAAAYVVSSNGAKTICKVEGSIRNNPPLEFAIRVIEYFDSPSDTRYFYLIADTYFRLIFKVDSSSFFGTYNYDVCIIYKKT